MVGTRNLGNATTSAEQCREISMHDPSTRHLFSITKIVLKFWSHKRLCSNSNGMLRSNHNHCKAGMLLAHHILSSSDFPGLSRSGQLYFSQMDVEEKYPTSNWIGATLIETWPISGLWRRRGDNSCGLEPTNVGSPALQSYNYHYLESKLESRKKMALRHKSKGCGCSFLNAVHMVTWVTKLHDSESEWRSGSGCQGYLTWLMHASALTAAHDDTLQKALTVGVG